MTATLTHSAQPFPAQQRALRAVVAGVAHELNTPLGVAQTGVSIMLDRLSQDVLDGGCAASREALADIQSAARLIERNIARVHALMRRFRDVAVEPEDPIEAVDLAALVKDCLLSAAHLQLDVSVDCRLPADARAFHGPIGHVERALGQLLANVARHACAEGTGEARITLDVDGGDFVLGVEDDGVGIPADLLADVFTPFSCATRSRGAGLGLAIVHAAIVEGLAGAVAIASTPGAGTRVTLRFPRIAG